MEGLQAPHGFEAVIGVIAFAGVLVNVIVAWLRQFRPRDDRFPLLVSVPVAALVVLGVQVVANGLTLQSAVAALIASPLAASVSTWLHEANKNTKPGA